MISMGGVVVAPHRDLCACRRSDAGDLMPKRAKGAGRRAERARERARRRAGSGHSVPMENSCGVSHR